MIFFWSERRRQLTKGQDICASIVFKAESKPKQEEIFFWGFSSKTKNTLFGGPK